MLPTMHPPAPAFRHPGPAALPASGAHPAAQGLGTTTPEHAMGAAQGAIIVGLAAVFGAYVGGFNGLIAGVTLVGGARNAGHAAATWSSPDPVKRSEAGRQSMLGLMEIGVGSYFVYRMLRDD